MKRAKTCSILEKNVIFGRSTTGFPLWPMNKSALNPGSAQKVSELPADLPQGMEAPKATEPPTGIGGGRGNCRGDPTQHLHIRCYKPVFSGQEGVCRVLCGMLQHIYRPGTHISRPLPGQSTRCHYATSFLATSTADFTRFFGTTNYVTRTDIVSGHGFGPLRPNPAPN